MAALLAPAAIPALATKGAMLTTLLGDGSGYNFGSGPGYGYGEGGGFAGTGVDGDEGDGDGYGEAHGFGDGAGTGLCWEEGSYVAVVPLPESDVHLV